MQVRCVKAFGNAKPGEIVSGIADGALVDPEHWEVIPGEEPPAPPPPAPHAAIPSAADVTPKEM